MQRAEPGAEGSSALLWEPRQGPGKRDRTQRGDYSHPCLLPTFPSLDNSQSLICSNAHQQISDKTDFQGKILIHWHQDVLTSHALVSQQLVALGIRIPTVPCHEQCQVTHNSLSSAGVPSP